MQRRDVLVTGALIAVAGCMGWGEDDGDDRSGEGDDDDAVGGGGTDSDGETATLTAAADLSVDDDTVLVQVTNGGENLDGIALVDDDGDVQNVKHEAIETGGSYELTGAGSGHVYGYRAPAEPETVDDPEATVNLGSVEFESS